MPIRVHPWLKKYGAALKLAVTLTLLAAAFRMVCFDTLAETFRAASAGPLVIAALALILGGFAGAASWFCILRLGLPDLRFRDAAACHWIGMFFNSFLPSNIGGDIVKGTLIHSKAPVSFTVASLFIDRAVNLALLLGIGCFTWLLQGGGILSAAAAFSAFLALLALALTFILNRFRHPPFSAHPHMGTVNLLLAAFASQFLKTWSNVLVASALGLSIPPACVWSVVPLFGLVSALPISIGGLGVRELAAQGLAGPLQVDNTHLIALSLAGHGLTVLVNLFGAIPFFARRSRTADTGEPRCYSGQSQ